jgi:hypothetical protein
MDTPSYEQVGLRVRHLSLFIQITVLLHVEVMEGGSRQVHTKVHPSQIRHFVTDDPSLLTDFRDGNSHIRHFVTVRRKYEESTVSTVSTVST